MTASTWHERRAEIEARLAAAGMTSPSAEARWLTEHASGHDSADWTDIERRAPHERAAARLEAMVERRLAGEPLQYVLGAWSFRTLDLLVDPRVLIPRPETEWVVEIALREARAIGIRAARPRRSVPGSVASSPSAVVVDLGTGSGAIALSLAAELSDVIVLAVDASLEALAVARANGAGNGIGSVEYLHGDWYAALPVHHRGRLDLIVSNPPYVAEAERDELPEEVVAHEPASALFAGADGLDAIREIVGGARSWLRPGGELVVEHGSTQAAAVRALAFDAGLVDVRTEPDLSGRPRALVARARV